MRETFFQFAHPAWFLALLVLPYLFWRDFLRRQRRDVPSVVHSRARTFASMPRGFLARAKPVLSALRYLAFIYMTVALARPQHGTQFEQASTEGVDIVLAFDVSGSMLAEDFRPRNRLQVAKDVARDFVRRRPHDRVGLVAFAGQCVPMCPPTLDHSMLDEVISRLEIGELEDGTAIGMGIAASLERLRRSEAKSRIVVLLTDGVNNRGNVEPRTAADLAKALGVKIYTIGVGSRGEVPYPFEHPIYGRRYQNVRIDLDEEMLGEIAQKTAGRYFRATDSQTLETIFRTIDELEKTRVESKTYTRYKELFEPYLQTGAGLMAAFLFLGFTIFRKAP